MKKYLTINTDMFKKLNIAQMTVYMNYNKEKIHPDTFELMKKIRLEKISEMLQ